MMSLLADLQLGHNIRTHATGVRPMHHELSGDAVHAGLLPSFADTFSRRSICDFLLSLLAVSIALRKDSQLKWMH
jgi:hypothetical protein